MKSIKKQREAVYLVMQGDQVFWFKCINDSVVDTYVDRVGDDNLSNGSRCPWIDANPLSTELEVHLVLNTVLDELDHVAIEADSAGFLARINRYRCIRQLQRDHAQATVYELPPENSPRIASLLHHIIPDSWSSWLLELQDQRVMIVGVATATELLADWSRSVNQAVLLDMSVGEERRHLLVSHGVPLYMRVVGNYASAAIPPGLPRPVISARDSLEMLDESLGVAWQSTPIAKLEVEGKFPSVQWRDARVMAFLMAGYKLSLVFQHDASDNVPEADETKICHPRSGRFSAVGLSKLRRLLNSSDTAGASQASSWSPRRNAWLATDALGRSVRQLRTLARISQLRVATMVFAIFGMILFLGASVNGIKGVMLRDALRLQQQTNQLDTKEITQGALAIDDSPAAIARSMTIIDDFAAASIVRPEAVVTTIAGALAEVPAVSLDTLAWVTVSDTEYRDGVFSPTRALEVRERYWRIESGFNAVNVELTGQITGDDLSAQKQSLDRLVRTLEDMNTVLRVTILESPVDAALRSELLNRQSSQYRVSVNLAAG